jgi:PAS domain S-box-containing protein
MPSDSGSPPSTDLEIARAHLAAIVESSEDAVISKTLEGIVTSWNGASQRLFGWSSQEMIGEPILKLIPEELQHEETEILSKLRAGERIERYETTRRRKNGERLDISLTVSPIRDATGRIIGAAKVAHDITARRRAERMLRDREQQLQALASEREQLLEAERSARTEAERLGHLKDEFLATLSHELRTPLNAIQGWTAILLMTPRSDEDTRALQTIDRNVRTQGKIISDLLDMSRIVAGKIHLDVQSLDLHDVIDAAISTVRQSAEAKKIRIHALLDSNIGQIRGDPARLQQVLWNLLSNSVKFTPAGGKISLVLERVNSHLEIVVEDTGSGIEPDFLPYVFDRFRQADSSMARQHGGLGLGLSIVKNLVELHGGSVRVKSPGKDQGSTFVIALPVSHVRQDRAGAAGNTPVTDPLKSMELPRLDGRRILIVDDEQDGALMIARLLQGRGAQTVCASNGAEALQHLAKEKFDILLSDVGMPGMDGFQLIREIRKGEGSGRRLAAIAVTAYARPEDRQRALLAGFQTHIAKPIDAPELIAGIASLLQLSL